MPQKNERLRIRCDRDTFVRFKKLAAEVGTYEETLTFLMEFYESARKTKIGPQVK